MNGNINYELEQLTDLNPYIPLSTSEKRFVRTNSKTSPDGGPGIVTTKLTVLEVLKNIHSVYYVRHDPVSLCRYRLVDYQLSRYIHYVFQMKTSCVLSVPICHSLSRFTSDYTGNTRVLLGTRVMFCKTV